MEALKLSDGFMHSESQIEDLRAQTATGLPKGKAMAAQRRAEMKLEEARAYSIRPATEVIHCVLT